MLETIINHLVASGPLVGTVVGILVLVGYLFYTFSLRVFQKSGQLDELHTKILASYTDTLAETNSLKVDLDKLRHKVLSLEEELSIVRYLVADINIALHRVKRKYPEVNGDLDHALQQLSELLKPN